MTSWIRLSIMVLCLLVAVLLSSCGGGSDSSTSTPVASGGTHVSKGSSPTAGPQTGASQNPKFPVSSPQKKDSTDETPAVRPAPQSPPQAETPSNRASSPKERPSKSQVPAAPPPSQTPPKVPPAVQKHRQLAQTQQTGLNACLAAATAQLGLTRQQQSGSLSAAQLTNINETAQPCIVKSSRKAVNQIIGKPKAPDVQARKITKRK